MAMVKPIVNQISAFDASVGTTISFTSNGGNQVAKNKIVVKNNTTNAIVYQNTVISYQLQNVINPNMLTNGVNYNYVIYTYDVNDNESPMSNIIPFYCYSTPTITFTNLTSGQIVETPSYTFNFTYSQAQGENLDFLVVYLYDNSNNLIAKSNNIYNTNIPPISLSYNFDGFDDKSGYSIQVKGESINGTLFESAKISFITKYFFPTTFNLIELTNNCDNGYVKVSNNVILVEGETNIDPIIYIDGTKLEINNYGQYLKWTQGYELNQDNFTLGIWLKPYNLGEFCVLSGDETTSYFSLELKTSIPYGQTEKKSYFELYGYENGIKKVYQVSNLVSPLNNLSYCVLYVRKIANSYQLVLIVVESISNAMEWNEIGNIEYNKLSNFCYADETYTTVDEEISLLNNDIDILPITKTILTNAVYDDFDLTKSVTKELSTSYPTWDFDTVIDCDFNNNIGAGNTELLMSQMDSVLIKRRELGAFTWNTIYKKSVSDIQDLNFIYYDCMCPSYLTMQYAIVPSLNNIEGNYIINKIDTFFNGFFICDKTKMIKLNCEVQYGDTENIQTIGQYLPIGSKYPITIKNSNNDYAQGSVNGAVLGITFDETRKINRLEVVNQSNEIVSFLKNGLSKIWKDWNGNIKLVQIIGNPSISYNNSYGAGKVNISFSWVEQGVYNNQQDLIENELIEVS